MPQAVSLIGTDTVPLTLPFLLDNYFFSCQILELPEVNKLIWPKIFFLIFRMLQKCVKKEKLFFNKFLIKNTNCRTNCLTCFAETEKLNA